MAPQSVPTSLTKTRPARVEVLSAPRFDPTRVLPGTVVDTIPDPHDPRFQVEGSVWAEVAGVKVWLAPGTYEAV